MKIRRLRKIGQIGMAGASLALAATTLVATPAAAGSDGVCSKTAEFQRRACRIDAKSDYLTSKAFCLNELDDVADCIADAKSDRRDAREECREQHDARLDLCDVIGEAPYAPDMDPALFQDPLSPGYPNPYFPLDVGNRWVYQEDGERIEIEVLDATKRIAGIDCIVYRDIVTSDGLLVEATDDWFGIRTNGDIEYCGEEVKDYEYFDGDDPEAPELTSIDGRFKVGVELAKSGTAFLGNPTVGTTYRQEWDPGNAEDVGTVLSTTYGYGTDPELDELVPRALADLMCANHDCIVIADGSTLDPGAFERKYYARGVGKILETKPDEGELVPIIECNMDARCRSLPVD